MLFWSNVICQRYFPPFSKTLWLNIGNFSWRWKLHESWKIYYIMMRFGEFDLVNMLHGMEIFLSFLGILERNNLMFTIVWWREINPSISLEFPIWEARNLSMFFFQRFFKLALVGIWAHNPCVATTRFLVIFWLVMQRNIV